MWMHINLAPSSTKTEEVSFVPVLSGTLTLRMGMIYLIGDLTEVSTTFGNLRITIEGLSFGLAFAHNSCIVIELASRSLSN